MQPQLTAVILRRNQCISLQPARPMYLSDATQAISSYPATQPMYLAATGATDVSQRRNLSYLKLSQVILGETIPVTARCNPTKPKLSQVISSYL